MGFCRRLVEISLAVVAIIVDLIVIRERLSKIVKRMVAVFLV